MAKIYPHKQRDSLRVEFKLTLGTKKVRRPIYTRERAIAETWQRQTEELELATSTGRAHQDQIQAWIDKKWLKLEEAEIAFPGFHESIERQRRREQQGTDYDRLEQACSNYSLDATQGSGGADTNHASAMGHFRHALRWLQANIPNLSDMEMADAERYRTELEAQFAPWTVHHRMTKMRIALDQAIALHMATTNPVRQVSWSQPKRERIPPLLSMEDIQWILETSMKYRQWLSGALPSIVRMGLGAGLRDIEMTWFTWDWIDWRHGVIRIEKTICDANGREWLPKTHEARAIDVESEFIDYMKMEQKRQQELGLLNQFVIPAGGRNMTSDRCKLSWDQVEAIRKSFVDGAKRAQLAAEYDVTWNMIDDIVKGRKWKKAPTVSPYLGRPIGQREPQKAFRKMMLAEGRMRKVGTAQQVDFTVYAMRYAYIRYLMLPEKYGGAALPPHMAQARAGHKDIRTTMQYARDLDVEALLMNVR